MQSIPEVHPQLKEFYIHVLSAIDGKEEWLVKPEQVLRVLKVMDAIFESAEIKKGVSCKI